MDEQVINKPEEIELMDMGEQGTAESTTGTTHDEAEREEAEDSTPKEEKQEEEKEQGHVEATAPPQRGRKRKTAASPKKEEVKRKPDEDKKEKEKPKKQEPKQARATRKAKVLLSYKDYLLSDCADRILTCGEGAQLGHPGRTMTKKPRKVDFVEENDLKIVQAIAGGVHSVLLTSDGEIYACGINEKGTVPAEGVEPEDSTDDFAKINFSEEIQAEGKMVAIAAGASFTAAVTDKGSVIVWGNLRDAGGEINVHPLLTEMQAHPVVMIHHKKAVIVKIAAGENHLVMLSDDGKVFTFGDGSQGQLGRSSRPERVRSQYMANEQSLHVTLFEKGKPVRIQDIHAGGFWTLLLAADGRIFACGLNNFGHLGLPIPEEKQDRGEGEEDTRELRVAVPTHAPAYDGNEWTHLEGVKHIVARNKKGEVYGIGNNIDNALGLGNWTGNDDLEHAGYSKLERINVDNVAGATAKLGCSIAWTNEGDAYGWGFDSCGQLGLGIKDDEEKVVPTPKLIESAHLDGYKIINVSISDNHSVLMAKKE